MIAWHSAHKTPCAPQHDGKLVVNKVPPNNLNLHMTQLLCSQTLAALQLADMIMNAKVHLAKNIKRKRCRTTHDPECILYRTCCVKVRVQPSVLSIAAEMHCAAQLGSYHPANMYTTCLRLSTREHTTHSCSSLQWQFIYIARANSIISRRTTTELL